MTGNRNITRNQPTKAQNTFLDAWLHMKSLDSSTKEKTSDEWVAMYDKEIRKSQVMDGLAVLPKTFERRLKAKGIEYRRHRASRSEPRQKDGKESLAIMLVKRVTALEKTVQNLAQVLDGLVRGQESVQENGQETNGNGKGALMLNPGPNPDGIIGTIASTFGTGKRTPKPTPGNQH